ncbi:hypothetical protein PROFUN_02517 [Planoprotostelium fungivorum]|uniref:Uncharacterized protein n=1 Tax=Planoprotostelium fungivorum TaxID=1890364 RepID=A0A2P6MP62_9EUKA|nr:hypothetical protein PROFUN_02517 [Planoprotostelium fungivorum]
MTNNTTIRWILLSLALSIVLIDAGESGLVQRSGRSLHHVVRDWIIAGGKAVYDLIVGISSIVKATLTITAPPLLTAEAKLPMKDVVETRPIQTPTHTLLIYTPLHAEKSSNDSLPAESTALDNTILFIPSIVLLCLLAIGFILNKLRHDSHNTTQSPTDSTVDAKPLLKSRVTRRRRTSIIRSTVKQPHDVSSYELRRELKEAKLQLLVDDRKIEELTLQMNVYKDESPNSPFLHYRLFTSALVLDGVTVGLLKHLSPLYLAIPFVCLKHIIMEVPDESNKDEINAGASVPSTPPLLPGQIGTPTREESARSKKTEREKKKKPRKKKPSETKDEPVAATVKDAKDKIPTIESLTPVVEYKKITFTISVLQGRGLSSNKGDTNVHSSVRFHFLNEPALESEIIRENPSPNWNLTKTFERDLNESLLNDLLNNPLKIHLLEGSHRTANGTVSVDLSVLFGTSRYQSWLPVENHSIRSNNSTDDLSTRVQSEIEISISTSEDLVKPLEASDVRIMEVHVGCAYSVPEKWSAQADVTNSHFVYQVQSDNEVDLLSPMRFISENGLQVVPTEQENMPYLPTASNDQIQYWKAQESSKPCVQWGETIRRFISSSVSSKYIELLAKGELSLGFELTRQLKNVAEKQESPHRYKGVFSIDLHQLIEPGSLSISGRFPVMSVKQNEADDESVQPSENDAKMEGETRKGISSKKSSSSRAKPRKSKDSIQHILTMELDEVESPYEAAQTYVTASVSFSKPFYHKTSTPRSMLKVSDFIPRRRVLPRYYQMKEATDEYHEEIKKIINLLATEYTNLFGQQPTETETREERKKKFVFNLNHSGKYFVFKEKLKKAVVRIVREKFHRNAFSNREEMEDFLSDLYVYLIDELHIAINRLSQSKIGPSKVPSRVTQAMEPEVLKRSALEAEVLGRDEIASKFYQERIAACQWDPELWYDYAEFALRMGSISRAEELLVEAISLAEPRHAPSLLLYGLINLQAKMLDKAETFLREANVIEPSNPVPLALLSLLDEQAGHSSAGDHWKKAVELHVRDDSREPLSIMVSRYLLEQRFISLAELLLNRELVHSGPTITLFVLFAKVFLYKADHTEALQQIQNAINAEPTNAEAWCIAGDAYRGTGGELRKVIEAYERAETLYNEQGILKTDLCLKLGQAYLDSDNFVAAKAAYLRVSERSGSSYSWLGAGIACRRLSSNHEALEALAEANVQNFRDPHVWGQIVLTCLSAGNIVEAEQAFREAVKFGLTDVALLFEIAEAMREAGRGSTAARATELLNQCKRRPTWRMDAVAVFALRRKNKKVCATVMDKIRARVDEICALEDSLYRSSGKNPSSFDGPFLSLLALCQGSLLTSLRSIMEKWGWDGDHWSRKLDKQEVRSFLKQWLQSNSSPNTSAPSSSGGYARVPAGTIATAKSGSVKRTISGLEQSSGSYVNTREGLNRSGWLQIKGTSKFGSAWRKRYCVIDFGKLYWYKEESKKTEKGSIMDLSRYQVFQSDSKCFTLDPGADLDPKKGIKMVQFKCEDIDATCEWVQIFARMSKPTKQTMHYKLQERGAEINAEDLRILDGSAVGEGASGVVRIGYWQTNTQVAVKALSSLEEEQDLDMFYKEIDLLSQLRHPQIVTMYGFCLKNNTLSLVTEYVKGGDLSKLIDRKDFALTEPLILQICLGIAKGMTFLHSKGIWHRDLKPANILISELTPDCVNIKVCDFGLSNAPGTAGDGQTVYGTPAYAAPELPEPEHTEKVDVYSFAIIMWELYSRQRAWDDETFSAVVSEKVKSGVRPTASQSWLISNLMEQSWLTDPTQRPSFHELQIQIASIEGTVKKVKSQASELQLPKSLEEQIAEVFLGGFTAWDTFVDKVMKVTGAQGSDLSVLESFLMQGNGKISLATWKKFSQWFSPLATENDSQAPPGSYTVSEIVLIVRPLWFHGFISADETTRVLKEGQFLVRFSSHPGHYTVSAAAKGSVWHMRVSSTKEGKRQIFLLENAEFSSLNEAVERYRKNNLPDKDFPLGQAFFRETGRQYSSVAMYQQPRE